MGAAISLSIGDATAGAGTGRSLLLLVRIGILGAIARTRKRSTGAWLGLCGNSSPQACLSH